VIYIPADTLVWAKFQYGLNMTRGLDATLELCAFADQLLDNPVLGIYGQNGTLLGQRAFGIVNASGRAGSPPTQLSADDTWASAGCLTNLYSIGIDPSGLKLAYGTPFSVAFIANTSAWVDGCNLSDSCFNTQPWEYAATYEAPASSGTLPSTLPMPVSQTSFEMNIRILVQWSTTTPF